jgi:hypothetical protein
MNPIITYLLDKAPAIVAVFAAFFIAWKIAAFYFTRFKKTEEKVADMDKKVASLPCENHKEQIGKSERTLNTIATQTASINSMVSEMSVWIMKKDKLMIPTLTAKKSPRRLTLPGETLLEVSGGKQCIDENKSFFVSELDGTSPMTPFDVEERSLDVILRNTGMAMFNPIKNYIYYSPEVVELVGEKVELSLFSIAFVMSMYLRDLYLESHPEIIQENEIPA